MSKAYIGIGWIVNEEDRKKILAGINLADRKDAIRNCFHQYNQKGQWFFGELIAEIPEGNAKNIATIAALTGLNTIDDFGLEYGSIFYECGISIDEINEKYKVANFYFIHWDVF